MATNYHPVAPFIPALVGSRFRSGPSPWGSLLRPDTPTNLEGVPAHGQRFESSSARERRLLAAARAGHGGDRPAAAAAASAAAALEGFEDCIDDEKELLQMLQKLGMRTGETQSLTQPAVKHSCSVCGCSSNNGRLQRVARSESRRSVPSQQKRRETKRRRRRSVAVVPSKEPDIDDNPDSSSSSSSRCCLGPVASPGSEVQPSVPHQRDNAQAPSSADAAQSSWPMQSRSQVADLKPRTVDKHTETDYLYMSRHAWKDSDNKRAGASAVARSKSGRQKSGNDSDFATAPSRGCEQRAVPRSRSKVEEVGSASKSQRCIKDVRPSPRPTRAVSSHSEAPSLTTTPPLSASLNDWPVRHTLSADTLNAVPPKNSKQTRRAKSVDTTASKKESRQIKQKPRKTSASANSHNSKHQRSVSTPTLATPNPPKNKKPTKFVQRSTSHSFVDKGTSTENDPACSGHGAANHKNKSSRAASRSHGDATSSQTKSKSRNKVGHSHGDIDSASRSSTDALLHGELRRTELQLPSYSNLMPCFQPPPRQRAAEEASTHAAQETLAVPASNEYLGEIIYEPLPEGGEGSSQMDTGSCPSCGNDYQWDSLFCRRCGQKRQSTKDAAALTLDSATQQLEQLVEETHRALVRDGLIQPGSARKAPQSFFQEASVAPSLDAVDRALEELQRGLLEIDTVLGRQPNSAPNN
eukprot:TRINITY_DN92618_c0_g1_i1.p1 TRINITY_DN92618_c0_g1~~TRINITY_DN92618_c0_g1_i1.p1  ORF type:complete len:695 (+),score=112.54 TRINITY_DN92618_c0_g1_i1:39-2123(+)